MSDVINRLRSIAACDPGITYVLSGAEIKIAMDEIEGARAALERITQVTVRMYLEVPMIHTAFAQCRQIARDFLGDASSASPDREEVK